ncbi:sugar ABC transporter permease [Paenibacillus marchantiophytorum]|uniref:Sugar ABC transporter permease n=1 Tax=Paenibacillus marchantiophytorum TaxID=1619310 RepID=A0ABQ1F0U5_9BACL|nr:carbohydrate ABC transporter permease [Paenibacillus marchantiophytorum]GFZ94799.1 sugar ABC transporter permease [Paenibacillus marchantiophytorum]
MQNSYAVSKGSRRSIPKKRKIPWYQVCLNLLFVIVVILIMLPLVLVLSVSFSDEKSIFVNGYAFIPEKLSLMAYSYMWQDRFSILHAYGVTIMATVIGSAIGLLMTAMYAYPISRRDFPLRNVFSFYVFITILFGGGLVPWYLVYTNLLNVKDSILALILPGLLMNGFNILVMRTFFQGIPSSLMESATIDGAGEFRVWWQIVMPLSLPVLATIGLFNTLAYWNDWFNSMIFISDAKWFSLQYVMQKTLMDIQFLSQQSGTGNASALLATTPTETMRMAMAIIGVGPIVLAYPFFQRYLVKGLTIGAVKG